MTTPTHEDPLMTRAVALKLHGLVAHWDEIAGAGWIAPLIQWEEEERARRGLERRLKNARLGRFKPLADDRQGWRKSRKCRSNLRPSTGPGPTSVTGRWSRS